MNDSKELRPAKSTFSASTIKRGGEEQVNFVAISLVGCQPLEEPSEEWLYQESAVNIKDVNNKCRLLLEWYLQLQQIVVLKSKAVWCFRISNIFSIKCDLDLIRLNMVKTTNLLTKLSIGL